MKKKVLALVAIALVMVFAFTACGATKLEGTSWKITGGTTADGEELTSEMIELTFGGDVVYSFEADGACSVTAAGQTVEGEYTQDGNKVTLISSGTTITGTIDGNKMTMDNAGAKIVFEKQ